MPKKTTIKRKPQRKKTTKTTKKPTSLAYRLCSCIKSVQRNTTKSRKIKKTRKQAERRTIAICVHSVVKRKGKRIRSFTCKKSMGEPSIVLDK